MAIKTQKETSESLTLRQVSKNQLQRLTRRQLFQLSRKVSLKSSVQYKKKGAEEIISFVLDTNVIMDNGDCLFHFNEHNVIIVSQVWRELDAHKKGHSPEAWNVRRATNAIDVLISGKTSKQIKSGITLIPPHDLDDGKPHTGKLILDFSTPIEPDVDIELSLDKPDDRIIMICIVRKNNGERVILVSNDSNCRARARMAGIESEKYLSETATSTIGEEDLVPGFHLMSEDFWTKQDKNLKVKNIGKLFQYTLYDKVFKKINCNEFLIFPDGLILIVTNKPKPNQVIAETFQDFHKEKISNVTPLNTEQGLALQLLTDDRISAVSIAGLAGSGKTLLTIAAAIHQTFDMKRYSKIVMTRSTTGSDEDIGFLPGTEEEKMSPWMMALFDNLEVLLTKQGPDGEEGTVPQESLDLLMRRIQIRSLNFMKGRTFINTFIIVDESQDLTAKKLKKIATRVGPGSKIVFLGNVAQIDDNYLSENTCGLSVFIRAFADCEVTGHVTLQKGERSTFATEAEKRL